MIRPLRAMDEAATLLDQIEDINALAVAAGIDPVSLNPLVRMDADESIRRLFAKLSEISVASGGDTVDAPGPLRDTTSAIVALGQSIAAVTSTAADSESDSDTHFADDGANFPLYGIGNFPQAIYVAETNTYWHAWEGVTEDGQDRRQKIRTHLRGSTSWTPPVTISTFALEDDDHGSAVLARPSNGHVYAFHGSHVTAQKLARTTSPDDPSAWTDLTELAGTYTYPHVATKAPAINLCRRSETLDHADWLKPGPRVTVSATNAQADGDGNTTLETIQAVAGTGNHQIQSPTFAAVAGNAYTFLVDVKAGTAGRVQLCGSTHFTADFRVNFSLSTGAVLGSSGQLSSGSLDLGNGMWRFRVTVACVSSGDAQFIIAFINADAAIRLVSFTAAGTETFHVGRAQVLPQPIGVSATYVTTTDAAVTTAGAGLGMYTLLRGPNQGDLSLRKVDSFAANGDPTWRANRALVTLNSGADERLYQSNFVISGTDLHIMMTRATANNSEREDLYYVVLSLLDDSIRNFDGSFVRRHVDTVVTKSQMDTNCRILDQVSPGGNYFGFDLDRVTGRPHIGYMDRDNADFMYLTHDGSAWTTPVKIGDFPTLSVDDNDHGFDNSCVVALADGGADFYWVTQSTTTYNRGGNISRRRLLANGTWEDAVVVRAANSTESLEEPAPILDDPDYGITFAEGRRVAQTSGQAPYGTMRCFAWNPTSGYNRATEE